MVSTTYFMVRAILQLSFSRLLSLRRPQSKGSKGSKRFSILPPKIML